MANFNRGIERCVTDSGITWTDAEVAKLRELWATSLSAQQIGRKIGRGKDSILGKVHRLGLPKRASPIKRNKRREAATMAKKRAAVFGGAMVRGQLISAPLRPLTSLGPAPKHCQWIESEPSANDACKCGAPVLPEFSYCAEHVYRAYLQPTPKLQVDALMKVAA